MIGLHKTFQMLICRLALDAELMEYSNKRSDLNLEGAQYAQVSVHNRAS